MIWTWLDHRQSWVHCWGSSCHCDQHKIQSHQPSYSVMSAAFDKFPLYSSPDGAECSLFRGGFQVIEKVLMKTVFFPAFKILLKQCLDATIISIKPIPVFVGASHFCGNSMVSVSKYCPVWLNIIQTKAGGSNLLSISTASDWLTMSLLSLVTFSHFGAFVPCWCPGG